MYECYLVRDPSGKVIYVGEGKSGRHTHVNSGVSHVYKLNQYHFNGVTLDVEVFPLQDKVEASFFEKILIDKHKSVFNTEGTLLKEYKVWLGRLLREVDERCESGKYKTLSLVSILREAVRSADNDFKITLHSKHMKVKQHYFSKATSQGNIMQLFFKHLSSMKHPTFLFIRQIAPAKEGHSYDVLLDTDVIQLKVKDVADLLTKEVKWKEHT